MRRRAAGSVIAWLRSVRYPRACRARRHACRVLTVGPCGPAPHAQDRRAGACRGRGGVQRGGKGPGHRRARSADGMRGAGGHSARVAGRDAGLPRPCLAAWSPRPRAARAPHPAGLLPLPVLRPHCTPAVDLDCGTARPASCGPLWLPVRRPL